MEQENSTAPFGPTTIGCTCGNVAAGYCALHGYGTGAGIQTSGFMPVADKWKFCPVDGKELQHEWLFCPNCGRGIGTLPPPLWHRGFQNTVVGQQAYQISHFATAP
jgi:hypothetical protein